MADADRVLSRTHGHSPVAHVVLTAAATGSDSAPVLLTCRFHNKGVYVKVGLQKISHSRSLPKELQLQVDAHNVPLPNIEGLIFLNIPR